MIKCRPCVVISSDRAGLLDLRIVVPFTTWREEFRGHVWLVEIKPTPINGLASSSAADSFQVKSLSTKRFLHRVGVCSPAEMDDILAGLQVVIEAM